MKNLALFAIFLFLASPLAADAYIDPGTGSFIIQVLLATVFGTAFCVKFSWRKIKTFFSKRSGKENEKSKEGKNKEVFSD